MEIKKTYCVSLDVLERETLLVNASEVGEAISAEEFIDYVETLINGGVILSQDK